MIKFRSVAFALQAMVAGLAASSVVHAQSTAASQPEGNKAGKPPVEAAASEAGVATKKPAKAGAQSGPRPAEASKTDKAGKPPVDAAASQSDVATKKPAKPGAQSGPMAASAPKN